MWTEWFAPLVGAIRLIHVFPSVTVVTSSVLLMFVARHGIPPLPLVLRGVGVVAGSQIAVGACNDFIDRHDDARMQPDKPLPAGQVRSSTALAMVGSGVVVCCGLALTFGFVSLSVAALGLFSGLAYDLWLKRTPFSPASYVISFLSLLTWLWLIMGALTSAILLLYPLGACLLLAANLANALPDAETDADLGQRGLAVVLGPRRSLVLVLLVSGGGAVFALIFSAREGVVAAQMLSLSAGILVALAAWRARRSHLDRRDLQLVFHLIAPAVGLTAVSCLLAFESL